MIKKVIILSLLFCHILFVTFAWCAFTPDIDDEDMADISEWTDIDGGTGISSQVTFDGQSCMKLDSGTPAGGYAYRTQDIGTFGTRTGFVLRTYFDALGTQPNWDCAGFLAYNGTTRLFVIFGSDGLRVHDGSNYVLIDATLVVQDEWHTWMFDVNWTTKKIDIYLDDVLQYANVSFALASDIANGTARFIQYGDATANRISYIDWFQAGTVTEEEVTASSQVIYF